MALKLVNLDFEGFGDLNVVDFSGTDSGTHKDLMCPAVRHYILEYARVCDLEPEDVELSVLTSGSVAVAVQRMLNEEGWGSLKCLIDPNYVDEDVRSALKRLGCQLYNADWKKKRYDAFDILKLTNNESGVDLTSLKLDYYDDVSRQIGALNPDYVFVPVGSGQLFMALTRCLEDDASVFGAISIHPDTIADKIYAPYRPFISMGEYRRNIVIVTEGSIGAASYVFDVAGIEHEFSGATGLAALMCKVRRGTGKIIDPTSRIIIVNTGKLNLEPVTEFSSPVLQPVE